MLFWDYILDIYRKMKDVQIIYGIYKKGEDILRPRIVDIKEIENTSKTKFVGRAEYDVSHLIKDIEADNDTFLVFEV